MSYKSVAVVSGGMDSVTMLHVYKSLITHVLNFTYGSKHNHIETEFAEFHSLKLGMEFKRIDLAFINDCFKSDLLKSGGEIPEGHYEDESMKRTVVPFRNGIMLSIAAGYAESVGASSVYIANHFGDHAIYPDCRADFIQPMSAAIEHGTHAGVKLDSPFCKLTKREIAEIGRQYNVDYSMTYSCYKGEVIHCGKCGTCVERKEALAAFDPTVYAS